MGCRECSPNYKENLRAYYSKKKNKLCNDCKIRIDKNPMRVFDCKDPSCKEKLKDISKALQVRKHKHKDLRDTLFGLVKDQEIRLIGKSYTSNKKPKKEYLIGKFDARSLAKGKSFAFVIGEDKDVFISSEDTLNAYDGDIVKVEVRSGKRDRKYGIIVKVIERNRGNFI